MKMIGFLKTPREVRRTGDNSAATSLTGYVWRMTEWHQVAACCVAVVVALLNLVPLELQRRIVNEVVETQDVAKLLTFCGIYVGVILLHQAVKFGLRMYQGWLTDSTILYTRRHLLILHGNGETEGSASGQTVSIVNAEVEKLGGFVGESVSQACVNVAMLLGVMGYMLVVEPSIALFALALLAPQVVLTPLMQRRLNRLVEERVQLMRDLGDDISQMDAETKAECLEVLPHIYRNRMKFYLLKFLLKSVLNLLQALGPVSVLIFGGYLVMQGETQVGVIVAFLSGFERLSQPLRELISFYRVAAQANVQHEMIAEWMETRAAGAAEAG